VTGMKPKIICTQCGAVLTRKDELCPSCGVAVDWEDNIILVSGASNKNTPMKEIQENKSQKKSISATWPSKTVLGAMAILAIAIVVYLLSFEKQTNISAAKEQSSQSISASTQVPAEIQELENSVAANPDDMSLTLQLANLLHDELFYEKAIPYYKTYLIMNPKDANARVDMGICYKEIGDFKNAENEMKTALQYDPKHLHAHFNLGIVCLSEGNIQEANNWFKKTVALNPLSDVGKRAQQLLTQHNSQSIKQ
jgi:Flp pilus assembly protein TadD